MPQTVDWSALALTKHLIAPLIAAQVGIAAEFEVVAWCLTVATRTRQDPATLDTTGVTHPLLPPVVRKDLAKHTQQFEADLDASVSAGHVRVIGARVVFCAPPSPCV